MRISTATAFPAVPSILLAAAVAALWTLGIVSSGRAQEKNAKPAAHPESAALVARGRYIVQDVAVCGQCHTPHNAKGEPDPGHPLEGAPLWLNPAMPIPDWPLRAPRIGGTPPATDEEMVTLLTTGIWTDGKRLRPPMPQFRMTGEDAQAVVAYLRSLSMSR
jgi:mono/diheme cytochrome c family protein